MLIRREFLTGSALAACSVSASIHCLAEEAAATESDQAVCVFTDQQLESSKRFSEAWKVMQATFHTFQNDFTSVWTHDLAPLMTRSAPVVFGHTTETCLHCIKVLSAGLGYTLDAVEVHADASTIHETRVVSWILQPTRRTQLLAALQGTH